MAGCRRGSDSKLWNVIEVLGRRNMEVPMCSPWLTLVGEAAEAVAHRDILIVLAACLVGRQQAHHVRRFGFDQVYSNGLKPKFLIGFGPVLIEIV
jgi:hypothetical protein